MEKVSLRPMFDEGARSGLFLGVVFTAMSACMLLCTRYAELSLLFIALGLTAVVYPVWSMARLVAVRLEYVNFAVLWLCGILQFVLGAMIATLLTAVCLKYAVPGYLDDYVGELIRLAGVRADRVDPVLESMPALDPLQFTGGMFWLTAFGGSVYSLLLATMLPQTGFFHRLVDHRHAKFMSNS